MMGLSAWKIALSLIIVVQLRSVVAEPFRFFTRSSRGTSPAADPARELLAPYVEFAYLNHGYFFFAPEPGPSHLMECHLTYEDGSTANLRFPDKHAQWPRLLYHRHFMLSEFLNQLHVPPVDAGLTRNDPELARSWEFDRRRFEMIQDSMRVHIRERYQATSVEIDRVEHRLPSYDEVFDQRLPLNAPGFYVTLMDAPPRPPNEADGAMRPMIFREPDVGAEEVIP